MSPYELDILLWYYCRTIDHPEMERGATLWRETINSFGEQELIEVDTRIEHVPGITQLYKITPRGRAYVEALKRVPLPTKAWRVIWPENNDDQNWF